MRIALPVIAVEQHGADRARVKAELPDGSIAHVWLSKDEMEALGFHQVLTDSAQLGDKRVDIPIENGGRWKWAASKHDDGSLELPALALAVEIAAGG